MTVKKRVGLAGRGKRGGVRTLVATNKGKRWFFVFGFEKNERANVSDEASPLVKFRTSAAALKEIAVLGEYVNVAT
jgi:hypothetical protein